MCSLKQPFSTKPQKRLSFYSSYLYYSLHPLCQYFEKISQLQEVLDFRFIPHAGFSYWPREHSEAHVELMLGFCSSCGPFPPVLLSLPTLSIPYLPSSISCMYLSLFFFSCGYIYKQLQKCS